MNTYITIPCEHCDGKGVRTVLNYRVLSQRRQYKGLSLREVARRLGFSAAFLSDVENGNRNPNKAILDFYSGLLPKAPKLTLGAKQATPEGGV